MNRRTYYRFLILLLPLLFLNCTKSSSASRKSMPDGVSAVPSELAVLSEPLVTQNATIDAVINEWGTGGALVVKNGNVTRVAHRRLVSPPYSVIENIIVSPDGERIAYVISDNGKFRLVLDGKPGMAFDVVSTPTFTGDSRHIFYTAKTGDRLHLVIDDKVGEEKFFIDDDIRRTKDGSAIIVVEKQSAQSAFSIVSYDTALSRKVLKELTASAIHLTPDLQGVAAVSEVEGKSRVVFYSLRSGTILHEGKLWDEVSRLNFDITGRHVTYCAQDGKQRYVVLDDRYELVSDGEFLDSPIINTANRTVALTMLRAGRAFIHYAFLPKKQQPIFYDEISEVQISPDGACLAYAGAEKGKFFLVANGSEGPRFDKVVSPRISPDGRYIVYRARQDGKRFLVIADAKGKTVRTLPPYEMVFEPSFTKDGMSVAYGVKDGNSLLWKVDKL